VLGHADPSFTLRTYAHSSDEAMQTASAALANLFETGDRGPVCHGVTRPTQIGQINRLRDQVSRCLSPSIHRLLHIISGR
jgi:hypothetical protein